MSATCHSVVWLVSGALLLPLVTQAQLWEMTEQTDLWLQPPSYATGHLIHAQQMFGAAYETSTLFTVTMGAAVHLP